MAEIEKNTPLPSLEQLRTERRKRLYEAIDRASGNMPPQAEPRRRRRDEGMITPERQDKAGDDLIEVVTADNKLTIRMKDSPIDRLAFGKKPKLNADQYGAAMRLYQDAYGAGLMLSGVIDPAKERVDGGQYKDITEVRMACQYRYEKAIKALDYAHFMIVEAIVVQEIRFADYAERFKRYKKRENRQAAALETLCQALDALARHYNPRGSYHTGIRSHMNASDRPIIMPAETKD